MKTNINSYLPLRRLLGVLVLLGTVASANAQLGNKWLEKAIKDKAEADKVEVTGDQGMVYVYATSDRNEKITDITGMSKIYCRAYIHEKLAQKASHSSTANYDLFKGGECSLNGGTPCEKYYNAGAEKVIERNPMNGKGKATVEYLDFEIDLVEATEWDVKNNQLDGETSFYVVLHDGSASKRFLSMSDQLTFDIKKSSENYASASIDKNKDLKLKEAAFENAELEAIVKKLFLQRGLSEVSNINFTSGWTVIRDNAGNIERRYCRAALSGKEDGKCKFYWFKVWEEYMGGGNYELPYDKNESFNGFNSELVPCENL